MERPTVVRCQAVLGDGSFCGEETPVRPAGNIPKYCDTHKDLALRKRLLAEWKRNQAAGADDAAVGGGGDTPEQESGEAGESLRVCRAHSCSIPLNELWPNDFCPAHWRRLGVETQGNLVNSIPNPDLHEVEVLRALREISRVETGLDSVTGRP